MSSTRQTRQNSRRNEQNQEQDETSTGMTERAQAEGSNRSTSATTESNEQPGDDYTTPSASFIDGARIHTFPELTMEELAELGWNIYPLKEKNMKMKLHFDFLKTCREENIVPNGLTVNKLSAVGQEDETFKNKWNGILRECSLKLMECLVEHYERQLAHNVVKIAESYESLEKSVHWTASDEAHLEEEIQSILEPKEKQLKEEKQSKLEAARRKKTDQQTLHLGTGTYADVLKRHIRAKLDTTNDPNKTGRPQRGGQQTNQMINNEPVDDGPRYNPYSRGPRWRGRSWNNQYLRGQGYRQQEQEEGYRQRRQQERDLQQRDDRRKQPQDLRYFLDRGRFFRNRYRN